MTLAPPVSFFPEADRPRRRPLPRWLGPGRRPAARRRRVRRALSAVLAAGAVWVLVAAMLPRAGDTVLVATRDLGVGEPVDTGDVRGVAVDADLVPTGALRALGDVAGRVVAHPVGAGEVVTTARLDSPAPFGPLPPDRRALHVPLADPGSAGTLRPGARVDLLSAGDGRVVGTELVVLAVDATDPPGTLAAPGRAAAGVVVAVPAAGLARIVVAASAHGPGVHVALRDDVREPVTIGAAAPCTTTRRGVGRRRRVGLDCRRTVRVTVPPTS